MNESSKLPARSAGVDVSLDSVAKAYVDRSPPTHAVGPISFTVPSGAFMAVAGPSGSGKSTLLRLVADLEVPSEGHIRVGGVAPRQAREGRDYGIVFQAPVLYDWLTVQGNVELPLRVAGYGAAERGQRAGEALQLVGLADVADVYPRQLSGGMQQRAAIARAISPSPRLLLMDEPFGALDEPSRERMNDELLRIWAETGVTVLFVTHDIEEAVYLADEVILLSRAPGRLAARFDVPLARPRNAATRADPRFHSLVDEVRQVLRG